MKYVSFKEALATIVFFASLVIYLIFFAYFFGELDRSNVFMFYYRYTYIIPVFPICLSYQLAYLAIKILQKLDKNIIFFKKNV